MQAGLQEELPRVQADLFHPADWNFRRKPVAETGGDDEIADLHRTLTDRIVSK